MIASARAWQQSASLGMAIMGFGGGAMIGAPLADKLMKYYATPTSVGVWETFLTMAANFSNHTEIFPAYDGR
jgi:hypothetical protein